jgi:hypothetical protein
MPKPDAKTIAHAFRAKCAEYGFTYAVRGSVVEVRKFFAPGDCNAYTQAEGEANTLVYMLLVTSPGSVWGTDGASIGGHMGLTGGYMKLNRSGISKRVIAALSK